MMQSKSNVRLASWRMPVARDPRLPAKVCLTLLSASLLTVFGYFISTPFDRANLCVVVLGPTRFEPLDLKSIHELDTSNWLCVSSSQLVSKAVERSGIGRDFCVGPVSSKLPCPPNVHRNSTLLVYISGILSIDGGEPGLCEHSLDAIHGGSKIDILATVRHLQEFRCRQVFLCVDATAPICNQLESVTTNLVWEDFRDRIEKQLLAVTNTPVATQFCLNAVPVSHEHCSLSPLAITIHDFFDSTKLAVANRLCDLQFAIDAPASEDRSSE